MRIEKVNVGEKLAALGEYWQPRLLGELNGQHVRLAKLKGEFVWHHHADEDELFLVVQGRLTMRLREAGAVREIVLDEGEMLIVPRGVEHQPAAEDEAAVLLFEPAGTVNTGNVRSERTAGEIRPL